MVPLEMLLDTEAATIEKDVLKNFRKIYKTCAKWLVFNKVVGLRPATLLKKRVWHRCLPVNFAKFLRTLFSRTPPDDCFCHYRSVDSQPLSLILTGRKNSFLISRHYLLEFSRIILYFKTLTVFKIDRFSYLLWIDTKAAIIVVP